MFKVRQAYVISPIYSDTRKKLLFAVSTAEHQNPDILANFD